MTRKSINRRRFLSQSASCSAHVFALACASPGLVSRAFAAPASSAVVAEEKWGRLEKLAEGVWAHVSTPFTSKDFTTVCNGGIIAGDEGVLAIESFASDRGAAWLSDQALRFAGRRPTDVVSTHYHGDHTGGHRGYFRDGARPRLWLTDATRRAAETNKAAKADAFENVTPVPADEETTIDLGGRTVRIVPRRGHTASDLTIELVEPSITWCGDLFFNRVFPNYTDATPSLLEAYVDSLIATPDRVYVPGHGPVADAGALQRYQEFLAYMRASATAAFEGGQSPRDAAAGFKLPASLDDWIVWSPQNAQRGFAAWRRELTAAE